MSGVGNLVRRVDYNSVRTKIVNIIGTGSATRGWGIPVVSSPVNEGAPITVNEYTNLATDINNAHRHIIGTLPSLPAATENNLVRFNTTDAPINRWDAIANTLDDNRFSSPRTIDEELGSTDAFFGAGSPRGSLWNKELNCTVRITFSTAAQARYFFNAGGAIQFESSRTEGDNSRIQNNRWSSILSTAAKQNFGGNTPQTGVSGSTDEQITSPADHSNYYRLTSANFGAIQPWYSRSTTTPYTGLLYSIKARAFDLPAGTANNSSGVARQIEFYIQWIDDYLDPGDDPNDPNDPGDEVDGRITLIVRAVRPIGPLVQGGIMQDYIEVPTPTINTIQQLDNNQVITPDTFVPVNQPPSTVNVPPSTVNLIRDPVLTVFRLDNEWAAKVNEYADFVTIFFSSYYGAVTVNNAATGTVPAGIEAIIDWTGAGGSGSTPPAGGSFTVNGTNNKFIEVRIRRTIAASTTWTNTWVSTGGNVPVTNRYRLIL